MSSDEINIVDLSSVTLTAERLAELDEIFFTSSARTSFADDDDRQSFRQRWLGFYINDAAALNLVAVDASDRIVGYILSATAELKAGKPRDPLETVRGYKPDWSDHVARFPAHLHINLLENHRGLGIGEKLVAKLCERLAQNTTKGVHLLTSANSRNVRFYEKCGFSEQARSSDAENAVVFLARRL